MICKALQHGVAGLLCRVLRQLPDEDLPGDMREAAGAYLEHAEAEGRARVTQTFDVLDALAADAIPTLPFKGVALAVMAHASPAMRPSRDIDVLVHRGDMGRAVASLGRLGYCLADTFGRRITDACYESYGQDIVFAQHRLPVEPHWAFAPASLAVDLDLDGLWRRTTTLDIAGRRVRSLTPEDTLLVACMHGAKEKWWRLLCVADVAALIERHPRMDWAAIAQRAADCGMLRMLRLGTGLARELFAARIPPELARSVEEDPRCLRLIEASKQRMFGDAGAPGSLFNLSRFHLDARERVGDRVRYVWRTMTTPQFVHYRMIALPDALTFGYVAVKLVHDFLLLPLWLAGKGRLWRRTKLRDDAP